MPTAIEIATLVVRLEDNPSERHVLDQGYSFYRAGVEMGLVEEGQINTFAAALGEAVDSHKFVDFRAESAGVKLQPGPWNDHALQSRHGYYSTLAGQQAAALHEQRHGQGAARREESSGSRSAADDKAVRARSTKPVTQLEQCDHCGQASLWALQAQQAVKSETVDTDIGPEKFTTFWELWQCSNCERPILLRYVWPEAGFGPEDALAFKTIYPEPSDDGALPVEVTTRLKEARKLEWTSPSAYAVAIARVLETVCRIEGARGGTLAQRLHELEASGRLPLVLAGMADQLRELRNFGAHDKKMEVTQDDVPVIRDFADAILEYLYRAPRRLELARSRLEARRSDLGGQQG